LPRVRREAPRRVRPDVAGARPLSAEDRHHGAIGSDTGLSLTLFSVLLAYLVPSFRRLHGDAFGAAAVHGLVAAFMLFVVVTVNRGILFVVVFTAA
jgi:hypothetical protein